MDRIRHTDKQEMEQINNTYAVPVNPMHLISIGANLRPVKQGKGLEKMVQESGSDRYSRSSIPLSESNVSVEHYPIPASLIQPENYKK